MNPKLLALLNKAYTTESMGLSIANSIIATEELSSAKANYHKTVQGKNLPSERHNGRKNKLLAIFKIR